MFKLMDLDGNEVKFNFPLVLSSDGDMFLLKKDKLEKIERNKNYVIELHEYGKLIPY